MHKYDLRVLVKQVGQAYDMNDAERERLRSVVVGYMEMKPIRTRPTQAFVPTWGHLWRALVLALIALITLSGSASYAAEGALPGDALYGIKVAINEELRAAFVWNPEARATLAFERAERRLEEAATLLKAGKLTPELLVTIASNFEMQAEQATKDVDALNKTHSASAITIASKFETRVSAHSTLLGTMGAKDDGTLATVLEKTKVQVAGVRAEAEQVAKVAVLREPSALMLVSTSTLPTTNDTSEQKAAASAASVALKAALEGLQAQLGDVEQDDTGSARLSAYIAAATSANAAGDALLAGGDYAGAYRRYQAGLIAAEQLSVFLKASIDLKIPVLELSF